MEITNSLRAQIASTHAKALKLFNDYGIVAFNVTSYKISTYGDYYAYHARVRITLGYELGLEFYENSRTGNIGLSRFCSLWKDGERIASLEVYNGQIEVH
jgi:hypothetical protein